MSNPYRKLPDYCFWSRSVTSPAPGLVDPVVVDYRIPPEAKIATMGSCFAQHLAKHIEKSGLNYYVAETAPAGMSDDAAKLRNYGVFSARYGNIYSVRQAVQLFERAFGEFTPVDAVWTKGEQFVDAFRPQIQPEPFNSPEEVAAATAEHLHYVREVFTRSDWLVFTLGLSEAWRSKLDGAVYPTAPGVAGGAFDPLKYEFINFSANEIQDDLATFITKVRKVNPRLKFLLTVSPVPLIATYENRHALVSTCYSKAALRVAADYAERLFKDVIYFPSYEIITSPSSGGKYYADDLRQVTSLGVNHVMRVFSTHFVEPSMAAAEPVKIETIAKAESQPVAASVATEIPDVICDEEVIEKALASVGLKAS